MKKIIIFLIGFFCFLSLALFLPIYAQTSFRFASMGDAHVETANFTQTVNQIRTLNPNLIIFNGDLENDGVVNTEMDPMINVIGDLLNKTFLVRGNHDDHLSGSAALWENYFIGKYGTTRTLPAGASNYVAIDSSSTYLTYSFNYGNSIFIGLDSNQYGDPPTSAQLTFLDQRLTYAEGAGLTHAFIFVHPPEYCVESTHCSCTTATGCGPSSSFISIINKHPIVSATFHGHEHILAWVHMSSTRVPGLTHAYEEFITSPAGMPYSFTPYPARMDYYNYSSSQPAFGSIDINGSSFTVSFYHSGTTTPVWTSTFTKGVVNPTTNPTATPAPTATPVPTATPHPTSTSSPVPTGGVTRPIKYYGVDRGNPITDENYSLLSQHAVKTIIVDTGITSSSDWTNIINLANKYNFQVVIWPNQGGDYPNCGWETPFSNPQNGDYIWRVKSMLDVMAASPRVIGIVTAHEPSSDNAACLDSISDMATIKTQIKDYVYQKTGRTDFKIWNYVDNIATNLSTMSGYTPADIARVMDVAVTWQHCFGGAEGTCPQAQQKIINDRNAINNAGLDGVVDLVYLFQTFSYSGGYTMPTVTEMHDWACTFLDNTKGADGKTALDGLIYYTWGACWYNSDLYCPAATHPNQDHWPVMNDVYNSCVSTGTNPTSTPTPTPVIKAGDANGDNKVDETDYTIWLSHYSQSVTGITNGDFNSNGKVDGVDYVIWLINYNSI